MRDGQQYVRAGHTGGHFRRKPSVQQLYCSLSVSHSGEPGQTGTNLTEFSLESLLCRLAPPFGSQFSGCMYEGSDVNRISHHTVSRPGSDKLETHFHLQSGGGCSFRRCLVLSSNPKSFTSSVNVCINKSPLNSEAPVVCKLDL